VRTHCFKGRIGIHELLQVNDELRELITRRAPEHEIRRAARAAGMRTLVEDGIAKAAQGLTTLEAVLKIVAADDMSVADDEVGLPPCTMISRPEKTRHPSSTKSVRWFLSSWSRRSKGKSQILIVEDDRTITTVVRYFLELEGFGVVVAKDDLPGLENGEAGVAAGHRDRSKHAWDGWGWIWSRALRADPRTVTSRF